MHGFRQVTVGKIEHHDAAFEGMHERFCGSEYVDGRGLLCGRLLSNTEPHDLNCKSLGVPQRADCLG